LPRFGPAKHRQPGIAIRHACISRRVTRVLGDGLSEILDAFAGAFRPLLVQVEPPLQIEVIGLQILRRRLHQAARIAGYPNLQRAAIAREISSCTAKTSASRRS
jgi:hypothetical protein